MASEEQAAELEAELEQIDPDAHWLEKMHGYLDWKIVAPQINNPYEKKIPDQILLQMAQQKEKVRQVLKLRCMCDGHEVMRVDNLSSPILITDHPCLTSTQKNWLLEHLREIGIEELIVQTIDRVQDEIKQELAKRDRAAAHEVSGKQKTLAQIKAERDKERRKKNEGTGRRIIYRRG